MSVNVSWGMLIAIPYVAILAAFNCISSMLTMTFFLEVKGVVDYLQQLLQHVGCGWSIGAIDGCCHHCKEHVIVDALVVAAIGYL
jgi:hypothetical protein